MADANQSLAESLAGPQSFAVDGQSGSEHPIEGQVKATRFLMATRARSRSPLAGVSIAKLRPHGAALAYNQL